MNPDVITLAYIGIFGLVCAGLILKESRVGWALFCKNLTYAFAFGYGALVTAEPQFLDENVRRGIRVIVAVAITWAIYELIALRVRRWREART